MVENSVSIVKGKCFRLIKQSYKGGHTEVYKSYFNENIVTIDINSLYSDVMTKLDVPVTVDKITFF